MIRFLRLREFYTNAYREEEMERKEKFRHSMMIANSRELRSRCDVKLNEAVREHRMTFTELYKM